MHKEKWQEILGNILDNLEVFERGKEHFDEEGGVEVEFIEFQSPKGRMRLEYIEKPIVLGKKTNYSHRAGAETAVDYIFSDTEKSSRLAAYEWDENENDWQEINVPRF